MKDRSLEFGECSVQVDGYSEEPPILCEAWAHIGKPQGSQPSKVMTDALKMLFCERRLRRKFRKILLFSDETARQHFTGSSWIAECLRTYDVETCVLPLPRGWKAKIEEVQKRQRR